VFILIFKSGSPGVEETEGASPDFVELAGVGSDDLVDRRGGIVAGSWVESYVMVCVKICRPS
jgi:hypothetical protein